MTTKLCRRCGKTLLLNAFSKRRNRGKILPHTQCRKCRSELHFQWLRKIKEENGKLFAQTRRYDPARADRLDRFRTMVKRGISLTPEPVVISRQDDEYHLFYQRDETK